MRLRKFSIDWINGSSRHGDSRQTAGFCGVTADFCGVTRLTAIAVPTGYTAHFS